MRVGCLLLPASLVASGFGAESVTGPCLAAVLARAGLAVNVSREETEAYLDVRL